MKQLFKDLFLLFFPQLCLGCQKELLDTTQVICFSCELGLSLNYMPLKKGCFHFPDPRKNWSIDCGFYLYYFKEKQGIETLLYALKYQGNRKVGTFLGQKLADTIAESPLHFDGIIGVPLHPLRLFNRGYNQVDLIGKCAGEVLKIPYYPSILKRKKNTPALSKTRQDRQKLMSNAFQINTKQRLKKGHYLIIDDIFTTGATLNACIKILNKQPGISLSIGVIAYRN